MKFTSFRGAAEFQVQSFAVDASRVKHHLEILDKSSGVIIPCFVSTFTGISTNHEHPISTVSKCAHDHIR
ncbi:MAG TPA: hypothetical protein VKM55_05775 [Candidatus Lokiarchaeia archaeon]|nr:hypothetical protein [Candidatus Lokiarchaeia archaeon]